jgi:hypothetical protein
MWMDEHDRCSDDAGTSLSNQPTKDTKEHEENP